MKPDPLAPPANKELLSRFLSHCRVPECRSRLQMLTAVTRAFARVPYENLTKIIKQAETGDPMQARRGPSELIGDHMVLGTGGTCFSLTAAFLHLVRSLGWEAEPILADRSYGSNSHCALVVRISGQLHLLDPGFLILEPILLSDGDSREVETPFNRLILTPRREGETLELSTVQEGRRTHRITFKLQPVDTGEYLRAWDASFDWEMMHYPLLTRVADGRQLYLRGSRLQVRCADAVELSEIALDNLAAHIESDFGVARPVAARALVILKRRGDLHG